MKITKIATCILLVLILIIMPAINGYNSAKASFVPFVVENAEWLLALLAGLGITFTTQPDAIAGAHKFAYDLDQTAYSALQEYIELVKFGQEVKKAIAVNALYELGIMDAIYGSAMGLVQDLIDYLVVPVDYVVDRELEYETYTDSEGRNYIHTDIVNGFTIKFVAGTGTLDLIRVFGDTSTNMDLTYSHIGESGQLRYLYNNYSNVKLSNISSGDSISVSISMSGTRWGYIARNLSTGLVNTDYLTRGVAGNGRYLRVRVDSDVISDLNLSVDNEISAELKKEDVEIHPRVGDLPLPSQNVDVWGDKIINVPDTVPDVIGKTLNDVLQQPAIDKFGNPVLDTLGNPVYEPVPQTWPNTDAGTQNPPWELAPDIEGVTDGIERTGNILENIKSGINNIGSWLLSIPALIASLFTVPTDINIDFDGFSSITLYDKFPFSLPWDLQRVIQGFQAEPEAPSWELPLVTETITIDFSQFSQWANIVKVFLSIIYLVALIIITKSFLG